jgi:hypothetical protein
VRATALGRTLRIERQTMSETDPAPHRQTAVRARSATSSLQPAEEGLFTAELALDEPGLVEVTSGDLRALAHVGAVDAPEFRATVSTTGSLARWRKRAAALTTRVNATATNLPQILPTRAASVNAGDRMGLARQQRKRAQGRERGAVVRWISWGWRC